VLYYVCEECCVCGCNVVCKSIVVGIVFGSIESWMCGGVQVML
jgi:hypothetical protein